MSRSFWKGPFVSEALITKVQKSMSSSKLTIINTWSRKSTIIPMFVGVTFGVHNGKKFIPVTIVEDMVGSKLGEYSPTRTYYGHGANKKVKKK